MAQENNGSILVDLVRIFAALENQVKLWDYLTVLDDSLLTLVRCCNNCSAKSVTEPLLDVKTCALYPKVMTRVVGISFGR